MSLPSQNQSLQLLTIQESFDKPLPLGQRALPADETRDTHISSTITGKSEIPSVISKIEYETWNRRAELVLGAQPVTKFLAGHHGRAPQLAEWEQSRYFVSEGDVVEATTTQLTNPVDVVFEKWCNQSLQIRAEYTTKDGYSRCDRSWHVSGDGEKALAVLELKRTNVIDQKDFDHASKPRANAIKILKQAVHYSVSYQTRFVAVFDWCFLLLIVFNDIELPRQKERMVEMKEKATTDMQTNEGNKSKSKSKGKGKGKEKAKKADDSKPPVTLTLEGGKRCSITLIENRAEMRRALLGFLHMAHSNTSKDAVDLSKINSGGLSSRGGQSGGGDTSSSQQPSKGGGSGGQPNQGGGPSSSGGHGHVHMQGMGAHGAQFGTGVTGGATIPMAGSATSRPYGTPVNPAQNRHDMPLGPRPSDQKNWSKEQKKKLEKMEKENQKRSKKGQPLLVMDENGDVQVAPPNNQRQGGYGRQANQQPRIGARDAPASGYRQRSQSRDRGFPPDGRPPTREPVQEPFPRQNQQASRRVGGQEAVTPHDYGRSRSRDPSGTRGRQYQDSNASYIEETRGRSRSRNDVPDEDRKRSKSWTRLFSLRSSSRDRSQSRGPEHAAPNGRYQTPLDAPPVPLPPPKYAASFASASSSGSRERSQSRSREHVASNGRYQTPLGAPPVPPPPPNHTGSFASMSSSGSRERSQSRGRDHTASNGRYQTPPPRLPPNHAESFGSTDSGYISGYNSSSSRTRNGKYDKHDKHAVNAAQSARDKHAVQPGVQQHSWPQQRGYEIRGRAPNQAF